MGVFVNIIHSIKKENEFDEIDYFSQLHQTHL